MSSIVRIPPELDAFLRLPSPQSLMVRGPPGSGKTMLCMALMEAFAGRRVYVSLRVSRQSLFDQIPWLGKIPPGEVEVIDSATDADQVQDHAITEANASALLANADEAVDLSEFLWLPRPVQAAWSVVGPRTPTLMVFDSWDAVIDQYFEREPKPEESLPSRAEVERLLLSRMARGNIVLVVVLERDSSSVLDYHVNGIVETYRQMEEGRLERWLRMPKLRGVSIGTDTYPFTLVHGRFAAITPTRIGDRYRLEAPVPDPQPDAPGLWPGDTDLAEGFGRLRPGSLTLLELDSAVPREIPRAILGPIIIHVLGLGGRALVLPPPSVDRDDAYVSVRDHVPAEAVRSRLRVLSAVPLGPDESDIPEMVVPFHKIGWTKSGPPLPMPEDPEFLFGARNATTPNIVVAYLSGLEALTEAAGLPLGRGVLPGLVRSVFPRSSLTHVAVVGRTGDPLFQPISPVSDLHIRLRCPHGRIVLNGHRPYLAPLVFSQEPGREPYRLTPVL